MDQLFNPGQKGPSAPVREYPLTFPLLLLTGSKLTHAPIGDHPSSLSRTPMALVRKVFVHLLMASLQPRQRIDSVLLESL